MATERITTTRRIGRGRRAPPEAPTPAAPPAATAAKPPPPPVDPRFVTFVVESTRADKTPVWLTPARTWSTTRAEAASFTLLRTPKVLQRTEIERRCHQLAGGLRLWLGLVQNEADLWQSLAARYSAQLWPDGKPEAKAPAEAEGQLELLDTAFRTDQSIDAAGLRAIRIQRRQIEFIATWTVVKVQVPPGWEDIAELPDEPPELATWLINAYDQAAARVTEALGNG